MKIADLEKRLAAVEREVERLKKVFARHAMSRPVPVLEQIHGTFEDDEAYREAARLGRQWRIRQRPRPRPGAGKRR